MQMDRSVAVILLQPRLPSTGNAHLYTSWVNCQEHPRRPPPGKLNRIARDDLADVPYLERVPDCGAYDPARSSPQPQSGDHIASECHAGPDAAAAEPFLNLEGDP